MSRSEKENYCCCCCSSAPISSEVKIDKTGFLVGDIVSVSWNIDNQSNRSGTMIATLVETATYFCNEQSITIPTRYNLVPIGGANTCHSDSPFEKIKAGGNKRIEAKYQIPKCNPNYECPSITIKHSLDFKVSSFCAFKKGVSIPVVISTVDSARQPVTFQPVPTGLAPVVASLPPTNNNTTTANTKKDTSQELTNSNVNDPDQVPTYSSCSDWILLGENSTVLATSCHQTIYLYITKLH